MSSHIFSKDKKIMYFRLSSAVDVISALSVYIITNLNFPEEIKPGCRLHLLSMNEEYKCEDNQSDYRLPLQRYVCTGGAYLLPADISMFTCYSRFRKVLLVARF